MFYFRYLCLYALSGDLRILCCVFCTICRKLLWIVHFCIASSCSLTFIIFLNVIGCHWHQSIYIEMKSEIIKKCWTPLDVTTTCTNVSFKTHLKMYVHFQQRYLLIGSVSSPGASFEHDIHDNILHMHVITFYYIIIHSLPPFDIFCQ